MKRNNGNRRRKILIDSRFQLRFAALMGSLLLTYFTILALVPLVGPSLPELLGGETDRALAEISQRAHLLSTLVLPALICTAVCLFAHGIVLSFRVAGPNYRFRQVFADLARLRIPSGVTVRKHDYMQDTATDLNAALGVLHEHLSALRRQAATMREAIEGDQREDAGLALDERGRADLQALIEIAEGFDPQGEEMGPQQESSAPSEPAAALAAPTDCP